MSAGPSLYRRHRPRTFDDVVGQAHVVRTLRNAVEQGKVHHAYMFVGTRGTGKTSMAKILAACLNCTGATERPTVNPCGACPSCTSIMTATSLDVIEMDAASNNSVDDVRELRESVAFAPVSGGSKVYILDEAHMLTTAAWNAFLKTLEEPPPNTIFVLATTEADKVLPTVADRCHRFDFQRPTVDQLASVVARVADQEGIAIGPDAVALLARHATGSFRDALGTLEQLVTYSGSEIALDDVLAVLGVAADDHLFGVVDAIVAGGAADVLRAVAALADSGRELTHYAHQLEGHARELLVVQTLGEVPREVAVTAERDARLADQASRVSPGDVVRLLDLLGAMLRATRDGADARTQLELALVKAASPQSDATTRALMARIERLEHRLATAAAAPAPAAPPAPAPAASAPAPPAAPDPAPEAPAPGPPTPAPSPPRTSGFPVQSSASASAAPTPPVATPAPPTPAPPTPAPPTPAPPTPAPPPTPTPGTPTAGTPTAGTATAPAGPSATSPAAATPPPASTASVTPARASGPAAAPPAPAPPTASGAPAPTPPTAPPAAPPVAPPLAGPTTPAGPGPSVPPATPAGGASAAAVPAAESTATAVADPVAPAGAELDLEVLRDLWPAVLESIRETSGMLGAVLADALPVEVRGDELVVGFDAANDFFRRKAEDRPNRDALVEAIRTMTGMRAKLVFELCDLTAVSPERAEAARPLSESEVLDRLVTAFDAEEVVEEPSVAAVADDPGPADPGPDDDGDPGPADPGPAAQHAQTPTAEERT